MIPVHFLICIPKLVGTVVTYSGEGPFKDSLLFLYRLAYASKLHLPVLITVCFMALDIRLQLEINVFWAENHQNNRRREIAPQQVNIIEVEEVEVAAENDDDDNDDASTLRGGGGDEPLDDEEELNFNPDEDNNKNEENGKKYDNDKDKDSDNNDNNGHSSNSGSSRQSNNSSNYDQHDHDHSSTSDSDENDDDDGNSLLFHIEVTRNFTTNVPDNDNEKVNEGKCISSSQYYHHKSNSLQSFTTTTTTKPSKLTLINDIRLGAFNLIAKSHQDRKYIFTNSLNPHVIALY